MLKQVLKAIVNTERVIANIYIKVRAVMARVISYYIGKLLRGIVSVRIYSVAKSSRVVSKLKAFRYTVTFTFRYY